jgi:hypothetical protein
MVWDDTGIAHFSFPGMMYGNKSWQSKQSKQTLRHVNRAEIMLGKWNSALR